MKSLVELTWDSYNCKLKVMKSIELLNKNEYYEAKFKYSNGYIRKEPYIKKTLISIPYSYYFTGKNILYVNGNKYYKNPEYWQKIVKEYKN